MTEKYLHFQKMGITKRQRMVLDFVDKHCKSKGYSPSYQEICDAIGIKSKSSVKRMIDNLVERGHMSILPQRARSLVVLGGSEG